MKVLHYITFTLLVVGGLNLVACRPIWLGSWHVVWRSNSSHFKIGLRFGRIFCYV